MARKKETVFKDRIRPILAALPNTWIEKIQQVTIRGTPDILCCINGRFVALELKVDSPIDKLQIYKLDLIKKAGGIAIVLTPGNFDETLKVLTKIAQGDNDASNI